MPLASGDVLSHLMDGEILGKFFTHHHLILMLTSGIMILLFWWVAKRCQNTPRGFHSLIEVGLVWVRDEIVYPSMGEKQGRKYLYFLWTLFFFILGSNLIGLLPPPLNPFGKTATGNIWVTASFALVTFFLVQIAGMRKHGVLGYWTHIVPPVPAFLWPLVFVIEIFGLLAKPFALTVRLFANMTAGHAIVAVLAGFYFGVAHYENTGIGIAATAGSIVFTLFIMLFETLVALIQAYIFTVLTAIFIGMAMAEEH